jgi:hypothetical protein
MVNLEVIEKEVRNYYRIFQGNIVWVARCITTNILRHLNSEEKDEVVQYIGDWYPDLGWLLNFLEHRRAA